MFRKKLLLLTICLIMLNIVTVRANNDSINVVINGKRVEFTNETGYPYVDDNNRTMVPLRATMEAIGAAVGYDGNKQTAIVITEHDRIEIPVSADYIYNNNQKIQNDTIAVINNGRVYLPIRIVLESANYTVEWDSLSRTVIAYNFSYDDISFAPYSTTSISQLIAELLAGNVVYINGNYYATPEYIKMLTNTTVSYSGTDINMAIYPQNNRFDSKDLEYTEISWVSGINNFDKILVSKGNLPKDIKFEESDIPGFVYVYCFYENGLTGIKIIYPVDEITDSFMNSDNATGEFNSIRMKKENGILYFNYDDLVNLGLYN